MNRICISLILILLCGTAAGQKTANALLWQLSRSGQDTSYLFGTMHLICADDYVWTPAMQQRFSSSKALCLELNLNEPELLSSVGLKMIDLSGRTLRDYLDSDSDYELLKRYIEDSLHQNMQLVERMKPVALYMMYTAGLIQAPCTTSVSYELKLAESAQQQQKQILGLETIDEQMEALESIPTDTIIAQMLDIARGAKNDGDELAKMSRAYRSQDLAALNRMLREAAASGIDSKKLVDNRNQNWVSRMGRMMQQQSTFFAVGAGHLYGLIPLLRQSGYTVIPIR